MGNLVARDDEASTPAGEAVTVDVLANDTLDGQPVRLSDLVAPPVITGGPVTIDGDEVVPVGTATVNALGEIVYTPPKDFVGVVLIEYEIDDGDAEVIHVSNLGSRLVFDSLAEWWTEVPDGEILLLYAAPEADPYWELSAEKSGSEAFIRETIFDPPWHEALPGTMEYRPKGTGIDFQVAIVFTFAPS